MFSSTLVSLAAAALFFLPSALSAPIANPSVVTDLVAVANVQVDLHSVLAGFTDARTQAKTLCDEISMLSWFRSFPSLTETGILSSVSRYQGRCKHSGHCRHQARVNS